MSKVLPTSLPTRQGAVPNRFGWTIAEAALAFIGAGIAGTLWWKDRVGEDVPCSADGGCALVAASRWSHLDLPFFPHVPVALIGLLGYVFLLTLSMLRLGTENTKLDLGLHRIVWLISAGGVCYSWYLQWVAHALIGAFCIWCRCSAITMTILFLTATWEWGQGHSRRSDLEG